MTVSGGVGRDIEQFILGRKAREMQRDIVPQIVFDPAGQAPDLIVAVILACDQQGDDLKPYPALVDCFHGIQNRLQMALGHLFIKFLIKAFKIHFIRIDIFKDFLQWFLFDIAVADHECF